MSASHASERIELRVDAIICFLLERETWRVPIADLRVIGEFTTTDGPDADDYFFVFVADDQWFEASFYAEGRDALLAELSEKLQHKLRTSLCHSTSLTSRVLWPEHLEGHSLFEVVPAGARTIFGWLRQCLLPKVHLHFTDEVQRELKSR